MDFHMTLRTVFLAVSFAGITACSSSTTTSEATPTGDAGGPGTTGDAGGSGGSVVYTVTVRGVLKADVAQSKTLHDQVALGIKVKKLTQVKGSRLTRELDAVALRYEDGSVGDLEFIQVVKELVVVASEREDNRDDRVASLGA